MKQGHGAVGLASTEALPLALHGGKKAVPKFEGRARPKIGADEFLALADTWGYSAAAQAKIRKIIEAEGELPSPHLSRYYNPRPSRVDALEALAKRIFGVRHALAVNSGTSALNAAYVACGIGPGDEVIVPAYTFFATAASVVACKALPVIAEIDDSLTLDPADVEAKITPRTKAIVPVHMSGNVCGMERLLEIARRHGLKVIEDCAQACGGRYQGRFLGTLGDLGCFSLSSYKITGAGEAGLVLTDDEWLHVRAQNQHDTAACWRPERYAKERRPGELFCGQNYRLSELEGAVNTVQLGKTEAQAARYNANARRISAGLDSFERLRPRRSNDPEGDVGYTLVLLAEDGESAGTLAKALQAEGVPAHARGNKQSRDWHLYKYWEHILEQKSATEEGCPFRCPFNAETPRETWSPEMCARSVTLIERAVFISVSQYWTPKDCDGVAAAINKVGRHYG